MNLSPQNLDALAKRMREKREELLARTHADAAEAQEARFADLAGEARDPGDEASADLLSDLATSDVTRDLAELRELEAALERIGKGSYGRCADCGREIEYERLEVAPTAMRCIDCQTVREHTYVQPGHSSL